VSDNYLAAQRALGLGRADLHRLAVNSFEASFPSESEKRAHVAEVDAYAAP
jgi:adenosine deaminase